jgi:hypothetical protein
LVEQRTENPRVGGSIPSLATPFQSTTYTEKRGSFFRVKKPLLAIFLQSWGFPHRPATLSRERGAKSPNRPAGVIFFPLKGGGANFFSTRNPPSHKVSAWQCTPSPCPCGNRQGNKAMLPVPIMPCFVALWPFSRRSAAPAYSGPGYPVALWAFRPSSSTQ